MSSSRFFCHTCKKDIIPLRLDELTCPTCNGEFVEEVEDDDPPQPSQAQAQAQPQQQQQPQGIQNIFNLGMGMPMGGGPDTLLQVAQFVNQMFRMNGNPVASPVNNNNSNPNPNVNMNTNNTGNTTGTQRTFTFQNGPFHIHGFPSPPHQHQPHSNNANNPNNNTNNNTNANNNNNQQQMPPFFQMFPFPFPPNMFEFNFGGTPLAGNLGDYAFGSNFEALLNQLFQNANHSGAPPAAKSAIDELNKGLINESHVESKADCAICKEELELGTEYIEMPCKHIFDQACILQWLAIHNSCPVCRLELKTDNPDYESRRPHQ